MYWPARRRTIVPSVTISDGVPTHPRVSMLHWPASICTRRISAAASSVCAARSSRIRAVRPESRAISEESSGSSSGDAVAGSKLGVLVADSLLGEGEAFTSTGVRVGTGNGVAVGVQAAKYITASPTLTQARLATWPRECKGLDQP